MLPIVLNTADRPIALVGNGARAVRRLEAFDRHGVEGVRVFAPAAEPELETLATGRLITRLPMTDELGEFTLLFISDLSLDIAQALAAQARAKDCLVHVEDNLALCDFHMPAIVRRGDLLLTASTNGQAPGLARRVRIALESLFGPEWAGRVAELSAARGQWRKQGETSQQVGELTDQLIAKKGWL